MKESSGGREKVVLDTIVGILRKRLNPTRILLFGSRAEGRAQNGSDFDIAVDKDRPDFRMERETLDEINEAAGLYKVDLVFLPQASGDFKKLIEQTGKVIYEE